MHQEKIVNIVVLFFQNISNLVPSRELKQYNFISSISAIILITVKINPGFPMFSKPETQVLEIKS